MPNDSVPSPKVIGLECESLEGASWGTGRIVANLLGELARLPEIEHRYRFLCYSNNTLPSGIVPDHPAFVTRTVGLRSLAGWLPSSFSIYYYVLLPLRLMWDAPAMMYYANYMLPIIHPPWVKSLVMLTDDIYREGKNPDFSIIHRIAYRIFATGWAAHRATGIHVISEASAATLTKLGIDAGRLYTNPLGVAMARPGSEASPSTFLFVGQAFERRRLRESLAAFERIAVERPGLMFRIIGTDKYPAPTVGRTVAAVNGRLGREAVTWKEYVDDATLAAAYRGAGALVYVSDSEAFGLPPLEALEYGSTPVVADTPLNREIYRDAAFFVAAPFDEHAIEKAMRSTLDDAAQRLLIRTAAPDILARYTWPAHTRTFLRIAEQLTT